MFWIPLIMSLPDDGYPNKGVVLIKLDIYLFYHLGLAYGRPV